MGRPLVFLETALLAVELYSAALAPRNDRVGPEAEGRVLGVERAKQALLKYGLLAKSQS